MLLYIHNESHQKNRIASRFNTAFFEILLKKAESCILKNTKYIPKETDIVELNFVDDKIIRSLNKKYRNQDIETDVLSLSFLEGMTFPGEKIVGEIYISMETAKKQAKEKKHSLKRELQILFVHGLLHIFGFDHEKSEQDAKKMAQMEQKILGESGLCS